MLGLQCGTDGAGQIPWKDVHSLRQKYRWREEELDLIHGTMISMVNPKMRLVGGDI